MHYSTNRPLWRFVFIGLHILSGSPMRVLHSLKESLLRIYLVRPTVSFKIVDIERPVSVILANLRICPIWFLWFFKFVCSEDERLCTHASPSLRCRYCPLGFSFLWVPLTNWIKLNSTDGSFKLTAGLDVYIMNVYGPKLMDKRCDKLSFLNFVSLTTTI